MSRGNSATAITQLPASIEILLRLDLLSGSRNVLPNGGKLSTVNDGIDVDDTLIKEIKAGETSAELAGGGPSKRFKLNCDSEYQIFDLGLEVQGFVEEDLAVRLRFTGFCPHHPTHQLNSEPFHWSVRSLNAHLASKDRLCVMIGVLQEHQQATPIFPPAFALLPSSTSNVHEHSFSIKRTGIDQFGHL